MFLIYTPILLADNEPVVRFYVEDRERYEHHTNPTFSSPADKNRVDLYSRLRVGADIQIRKGWSAKVEYQNTHDLFWTQAVNGSADNSDLSLAFAKYSSDSFNATVGRQKIELGDQRLIGSTEWLSMARSFDAGRVQSGPWDGWAAKLGVANNKPETAKIAGVTHTDKTWGTTSVIAKHDVGAAADIDIQTLDHFMSATFRDTTLSVEGALQTGSNNGRDQRAWAWHANLKRQILPKTTLSIEGNAASGGGNANTSRTFDNLYPSNHDLYGLSDLTGWKNMNEFAIRLDNHPLDRLSVRASFEAYSLRDPSDAWYSATGVVNPRAGGTFVDATGASGRDLGQELDFSAAYQIKKYGTISGGIAFFNPGHYVQQISGQSNMLTYGYIQYQVRF